MSRFLKFIVHLVVICAIICALGMTIPQFFGVTTYIVDDAAKKTNLPMGSVTYAIPVKTEEIRENDPVLVQEDDGTYRYNMKSVSLATGTGVVVDTTITEGKDITVAVRDYVPKVVITIGYVGYLLVATKSTEGLIILGLILLFLIILFIIAELWKKDDREYEEADEDAPGYVKSARELRREEKEKARRMKQEEREIKEESRSGRKKKKAEKKKLRTGGFVDEIDEDDDEVDDVEPVPVSSPIQPAVGEAHEFLRKEIAAATAEKEQAVPDGPSVQEEVIRLVSGAPAQESRAAAPAEEEIRIAKPAGRAQEPVEIRKRAIPGLNADELAEQAKTAGDSPDIVKDDITNVTLFDYSDILNEE